MNALHVRPFKASEDPHTWWSRVFSELQDGSGLTCAQIQRCTGINRCALARFRKDGCIPRDVAATGAQLEAWSGVSGIVESLTRAQRVAKVLYAQRVAATLAKAAGKPQKYQRRPS